MKICQVFIFVFLVTLLTLSSENKGGFYSYNEIQSYISNFEGECKHTAGNGKISIGNPSGKKVLIFGGFHGSLVTAAQVLGLAKNFCAAAKKDPEMNLYINFEVEFLPIFNENHYSVVYENKTDDSTELDYKGESCNGNGIDPDRNFEIAFKPCEKSNFAGSKYYESPVTSNFHNSYIASNSKPIIIINIQGLGGNIFIGPAYKDIKLTKAEKYTYDLLVTGEYRIIGSDSQNRKSGQMVDSAMNKSIYAVIYNTYPKATIKMSELDSLFKVKYEDIFQGINYALKAPLLDLRITKENHQASSENPSTITFKLYVTNHYPFDLTGKITLELKISDVSSTQELEYDSIEATTQYLYLDSSEDFESFDESSEWELDKSNGFYEIILENVKFNPQSEVGFNIKFTRKVSGQLAYTAQILLESKGYADVFEQVELTYADTSNKEDKRTRVGVILLMFLVFTLIVTTIVCLILSKKNKYNRLFI